MEKYAHARSGNFSISPPQLQDPYRDDPVIDRYLSSTLPAEHYHRIKEDLDRFGERVVSEIDDLGRQCELNQPKLQQQDAWGKRIDNLMLCNAWHKLKQIAAEDRLIAIAHDSTQPAEFRRLHQVVKLMMYAPSSGLTSCLLAMTDGSARVLKNIPHAEAKRAYHELTTGTPAKPVYCSLWMTESKSGSDGSCDAYAEHLDGDTYLIYGEKCMASCLDADLSLTLARIRDEKGSTDTKGVSLFLVRRQDTAGVQITRLRDKMGTRTVATGDLLLDGVKATLISPPGRGMSSIAAALNITRLHNAAATVGYARRIVSLARDYSTRRSVFGQPLAKLPLHVRVLADMEVQVRACTLLLLDVARLVGLQESGRASPAELIVVRLLTPVLKAYTAKVCVPVMSEAIECFGGMGYMEDSGIPRLFRDAQVFPIWEGTTNVLGLDVLRALRGSSDALKAFSTQVNDILSNASNSQDQRVRVSAHNVLASTQMFSSKFQSILKAKDTVLLDVGARELLITIGRIYCGALLVQRAAHDQATVSDVIAAQRFCSTTLMNPSLYDIFSLYRINDDNSVVFECKL